MSKWNSCHNDDKNRHVNGNGNARQRDCIDTEQACDCGCQNDSCAKERSCNCPSRHNANRISFKIKAKKGGST